MPDRRRKSMARVLRVVIIDDVTTYRKILTIVIGEFIGVECVGEFPDGGSGMKGIEKLQPDLVFLDVEMPVMNGIEVLKEVKERFPEIGVIMVSSYDRKQADITVRALELGAIDFIPKPSETSIEENIDILKKKIAPLIHVISTRKNLERIKQITGRVTEDITKKDEPPKQQPKPQKETYIERIPEPKIIVPETVIPQEVPAVEKAHKQERLYAPFKIDLVAIGTSTGGPYALAEVIPNLPKDFPVPIVIVQHMPPNFTASLANSLSKKSNIPVYEAKKGDVVAPGKILLAPGGFHMVLKAHESIKDRYVIDLEETPQVHGCRPSVDVLFKSIAHNFVGNVLSVVMTGMGSDGTDGVRALKTKKCYCLIQDEETSVVFGMPKMVMQAKLQDETLALEGIAGRITEIVKLSR